jgi:hypothetical protein
MHASSRCYLYPHDRSPAHSHSRMRIGIGIGIVIRHEVISGLVSVSTPHPVRRVLISARVSSRLPASALAHSAGRPIKPRRRMEAQSSFDPSQPLDPNRHHQLNSIYRGFSPHFPLKFPFYRRSRRFGTRFDPFVEEKPLAAHFWVIGVLASFSSSPDTWPFKFFT